MRVPSGRGCAVLLLGVYALLAAGCGEDRASEPPAKVAFAWTTDPPAALAAARERGQLVLAYLARPGSWCPLCRALEKRVFDRPEGAALAKACVPLKVRYDPLALGETRAFLLRHPVRAVPALLIMTPDEHVLHTQVGRLYPLTALGRAEPDDPAPLLDAAELRAMLADAVAREARERPRLRELAERTDAASRLEHARLLRTRGRPAEAVALYEHVLEARAEPRIAEEHVELLIDMERFAEALARTRELAARHPEAARAPYWRLREVELEGKELLVGSVRDVDTRRRRIEALATDARDRGDLRLEVRCQIVLAEVLLTGAAVEEAKRVLRRLEGGIERRRVVRRLPPTELLSLLRVQHEAGLTAAAAETVELLRRRHPDSAAYQIATHGRPMPIAPPR